MIPGLTAIRHGALAGHPWKATGELGSFAIAPDEKGGFETFLFETFGPQTYELWRSELLQFRAGVYESAAKGSTEQIEMGLITAASRFQNYRHHMMQAVGPSTDLMALNAGTLFWAQQVGSQVLLEWAENTADDFEAYVLLWDAGDGETPDTVYDTIPFRSVTQYLTDELADGTYKFWLQFKDRLTNQGVSPSPDTGKIITITVASPPPTPEVEWAYDSATRKITFELDDSVYRVRLFSNYLFGHGFLTRPTRLHSLPRTKEGAGDYDSTELWAGDWVIHVHCQNAAGILSDPFEIALTLVEDDGVLIELTTAPTLLDLSLVPVASADISISWYPAVDIDEGQFVEIWVSDDDGETYSLETTTDESPYLFTGVDGTTYFIKIRVVYPQGDSSSYGPFIGPESVTADGSPPEGDQTLTATIL